MKKLALFGWLLVLCCFLSVSCKTPPTAPMPIHIAFSGAFWTQTVADKNAANSFDRDGHTALNYTAGVTISGQYAGQGRMWVFGGEGDSGPMNDVWYSTDGKSWSQALADTSSPGPNQFSQRVYHSSLVYSNKMWVFGGSPGGSAPPLNDSWYSTDGVTWTFATSPGAAPYSNRYGQTSLLYNSEMWVIGGSSGSGLLDDAWHSTDGAVWTQAVTTAPFTARVSHSSVFFNGYMWVIGGLESGGPSNDCWYSTDGSTWVQAPASKPFTGRYGQTSVVFDNEMWVIGGNDGSGPLNDAWYSSDGSTWTQAPTWGPYTPKRQYHASVVFNNAMWVIAGAGPGNNGILNDVWYSN